MRLNKIFLRDLRVFVVNFPCMDIHDIGEEYADFLHDESRREGWAKKIAFPKSTEDVCAALAFAAEKGWPVTIQGGRTGITGGCVPDGGLILNLSRMDAIGEIDGDRMTIQPGATLGDIRAKTIGSSLFFPSDLTEITATLGGMVANNASGARSFKYGAVRNWIHALEVVLATGEIVHIERGVHKAAGLAYHLGSMSGVLPEFAIPDVKTAAGYFLKPDMDLVDLFIGAEGTLGIVTEITIGLMEQPEEMSGLTAFFASEVEALQFVRFLRDDSQHTAGVSPSLPVAIEFFDHNALDLLRRMKRNEPAFSGLPELDPKFHTAIYFEYAGEVPEPVIEWVEKMTLDCWFAEGNHEIETLKNFRHAIPESVNLLIGERKRAIPELTKLGTDMSVPDERLEEVMRMYREGLADANLEYVIFGHIGNNHVHVNILPRSMEEYGQGKALYLDWARQVVDMGGSVSAEHGIGKLKTDFLKLMFGAEGVQKMLALKQSFDPASLLNPGNLFG